jgi:lipoate-protein ligase A
MVVNTGTSKPTASAGNGTLRTNPPSLMKRGTWRLLVDGDHSAAWNMAVDEAILDAVLAGLAPPTLRVYSWDETAVTIGRFQDVARGVNLEAVRARDIPVVRRPTGGRAILHGGDLTMSIVVPADQLGPAGAKVAESYQFLSQGLLEGLRGLGLRVELGTCERRPGRGGDCFAAQSRADVLTEGHKLVGSAQRRIGGVILQQSSVRYRPTEVRPEAVFLGPVAADVYPLEHVDEEQLIKGILEGYGTALGRSLNAGYLTAWEEERAGTLLSNSAQAVIQTR